MTLGKTGALTGGSRENQKEESLAGLRALLEKLKLRRAEVGALGSDNRVKNNTNPAKTVALPMTMIRSNF